MLKIIFLLTRTTKSNRLFVPIIKTFYYLNHHFIIHILNVQKLTYKLLNVGWTIKQKFLTYTYTFLQGFKHTLLDCLAGWKLKKRLKFQKNLDALGKQIKNKEVWQYICSMRD